MEILTEITKEVFEKNVPSAKMPTHNDSVYNRLKVQLKNVYDMLLMTVVGHDFETAAAGNAAIKEKILRLVCLQAFTDVIRSLDLVLTATGFGIVRTDSITPASRERVDALAKECHLQAFQCRCMLIEKLKLLENWSVSAQAHRNIGCLFWNIFLLGQYTTLEVNADNWTKASGLALSADAFLRKAISDEYMDLLLERERSGSLTGEDIVVVDKCNRFTGEFISGYDQNKTVNKRRLEDITAFLNSNSNIYTVFADSQLYKDLHAKRYENKQEHPTFFFVP